MLLLLKLKFMKNQNKYQRVWSVVMGLIWNANYSLEKFCEMPCNKCNISNDITLTLLWRTGELSANHVSCLSVWQWAKHEFMNNPFWCDCANCLITFSIWFLNPVFQEQKGKICMRTHQDRQWGRVWLMFDHALESRELLIYVEITL